MIEQPTYQAHLCQRCGHPEEVHAGKCDGSNPLGDPCPCPAFKRPEKEDCDV